MAELLCGVHSRVAFFMVDGKTVDRKDYTGESGSTIVKRKHIYLQNLKAGTHTLTWSPVS